MAYEFERTQRIAVLGGGPGGYEAALAGAHIATVPLDVLTQMIHHPLTDAGVQKFRKDWEAAQASHVRATVLSRPRNGS